MFRVINIKKKRKLLLLVILLAGVLSFAAYAVNRLFPLTHIETINRCAAEYSLEPAFICAVIHAESKFQKDAASHKGASGLMQITEPTAYWLAGQMGLESFQYTQIFEPDTNIRIGCYYLKRLLDKFNGDYGLALAAYNAGEGNVNKWLHDPECSPDGITLTYIPFKETRQYIDRVTFNLKVYRKILLFMGGAND